MTTENVLPIWGPHRSASQDSELMTAALRCTAGAAMVVFTALGAIPDVYGYAWPALIVACLYATAALWWTSGVYKTNERYPRRMTRSLTAADNLFVVALSSLTGGLDSLIVAVFLLVITTTAARYGVTVAVVWAVIDSLLLYALALVLGEPNGLSDRLLLASWWAWLLIGGSAMAGVTARAAFTYREALIVADHRASVDRYERRLAERAREQLEVASADRREFLRVVSHELRTPITSIGALSRALASDNGALEDSDRAEMLHLLASHAGHLEDLLFSVRDLTSRGPAAQRPPSIGEVDVVDSVRTAATAAGLKLDRLRISVDDDVRSLRTDREMFRRVLTNLLENAARHSLEVVEVLAVLEGASVRFAVLDRGPGLSEETAKQAFERGFSLGGQRDSSGLGLWIVRELAASLGGEVWAEARSGGGLTVNFVVPWDPSSEAARSEA